MFKRRVPKLFRRYLILERESLYDSKSIENPKLKSQSRRTIRLRRELELGILKCKSCCPIPLFRSQQHRHARFVNVFHACSNNHRRANNLPVHYCQRVDAINSRVVHRSFFLNVHRKRVEYILVVLVMHSESTLQQPLQCL
jgi:hypothetical protein